MFIGLGHPMAFIAPPGLVAPAGLAFWAGIDGAIVAGADGVRAVGAF